VYTRGQRSDYDSWKTKGWSADDMLPFMKKVTFAGVSSSKHPLTWDTCSSRNIMVWVTETLTATAVQSIFPKARTAARKPSNHSSTLRTRWATASSKTCKTSTRTMPQRGGLNTLGERSDDTTKIGVWDALLTPFFCSRPAPTGVGKMQHIATCTTSSRAATIPTCTSCAKSKSSESCSTRTRKQLVSSIRAIPNSVRAL